MGKEKRKMVTLLLKSILHNIGVVLVGILFAFIGVSFDLLLHISSFQTTITIIGGIMSVLIGFLIRVWATYSFYEYKMKVISLVPQKKLLTTGAFRFSRNPLYLGGNLFIFLGTVLIAGSPSGIILTILELLFTNQMIKREEKQLEKTFGKAWKQYRTKVRRWL